MKTKNIIAAVCSSMILLSGTAFACADCGSCEEKQGNQACGQESSSPYNMGAHATAPKHGMEHAPLQRAEKAHQTHEQHLQHMQKDLGLSETQMDQLQALHENKSYAAHRDEKRTLFDKLHALDTTSGNYDQQVDEIAQGMAAITVNHVKERGAFRKAMDHILTPEQRDKARKSCETFRHDNPAPHGGQHH